MHGRRVTDPNGIGKPIWMSASRLLNGTAQSIGDKVFTGVGFNGYEIITIGGLKVLAQRS
jgi:hypothetical protein